MRCPNILLTAAATTLGFCVVSSNIAVAASLTAGAINAASLDLIPASYSPLPKNIDPVATGSIAATSASFKGDAISQAIDADAPSPSVARLQVLLDRSGASPGVIDGRDGVNLRNAVSAFETMHRLPADGKVGPQVIGAILDTEQVIGTYVIAAEDIALVVGPIPRDYARMAEMHFLGYATASE